MKDMKKAGELAEDLVNISRMSGKKASALITSMNHPIGLASGNALEVQESMDVLAAADRRIPWNSP